MISKGDIMTDKIKSEDYGLYREPSEGQLFLLKYDGKMWAEEVAFKLKGLWYKSLKGSKYRVFWSSVETRCTEGDLPALKKILKEAEHNG